MQKVRFEGTPAMEVQSSYQTACSFIVQGSADGTGVAVGSIACTGPFTPVTLALSTDMARCAT